MSAVVAVTDRAHVAASAAAQSALCGASVRGAALFAVEPGSDLGAHPTDCGQCVKLWKGEKR